MQSSSCVFKPKYTLIYTLDVTNILYLTVNPLGRLGSDHVPMWDCLESQIRPESPQDFACLLLSWKHIPNVIIYDFAQGLATHINLRASEKVPLSPFEGRLAEPSHPKGSLKYHYLG